MLSGRWNSGWSFDMTVDPLLVLNRMDPSLSTSSLVNIYLKRKKLNENQNPRQESRTGISSLRKPSLTFIITK